MTRAEVEEEEGRTRSKLRDERGKLEDWRLFLFAPVIFVGRAVAVHYQLAPEWVLSAMAMVLILGLVMLLHKRLPQEQKTWRQLRKDAAAAGYLLCPDCGHDLRGSTQAGKEETVCPECGRRVAVSDLKEIWTKKW